MGGDWPKKRAAKLKRDPYCEMPHDFKVRAMTVDHIKARAFGGSGEPSNLRSLCSRHAAIKNHQDREEGKRRKR